MIYIKDDVAHAVILKVAVDVVSEGVTMNDQIPVKNVTPIKVHKPKGAIEGKRYDSRSRIYVRAVKGPLESFRRFFGLFFLGLFAISQW